LPEIIINSGKNIVDTMDSADLEILKLLSQNSRMHSTEIAQKLGLATSTVHKRINLLEKSGVIERFTIVMDPSNVGMNITTYIGINIDQSKRINIINKLKNIDDVIEIYELLEPYDLFLKVRTFDINSLKENVLRTINELDGVEESSSLLTTKRHKEVPCCILKR